MTCVSSCVHRRVAYAVAMICGVQNVFVCLCVCVCVCSCVRVWGVSGGLEVLVCMW